ncbi:MAG TPA: hypothetical protein VF835_05660 [Rhizomicrobium sp.]
MPNYEIRYLNSEGEPALIHKTHHENDEAVGRAAFRMVMGSGFAEYEIWREDESDAAPDRRERDTRRRILKSTLRVV